MAILQWLTVTISMMAVSVKGERSVRVIPVTDYNDRVQDSYRLYMREEAPTITTCAVLCLQDLECVSFFYHQQERWCQGHSVLFTGSGGGVLKTGSRYYQVYEDTCYGGNGYINHRKDKLCFKIYNSSLSLTSTSNYHQDVVDFCSSRQEALISHLSQSQVQALIRQFNVTSFKTAFIDGTDRNTEGTWHYGNGDVMQVLLWGPDEPENDYVEDHFLNLRLFDDGKIGMSDTADKKMDFICQKPI